MTFRLLIATLLAVTAAGVPAVSAHAASPIEDAIAAFAERAAGGGGGEGSEVALGDDRPTQAEIAFCAIRVRMCLRALELAREARAEAISRYGEMSLVEGEGDAFSHCYWSGLMTFEWNRGVALGFGNRHEDKPPAPWETAEERARLSFVDRHNNSWGREYASKPGATRDTLAQDCVDSIAAGGPVIVPSAS
jgi:hypothetical protein